MSSDRYRGESRWNRGGDFEQEQSNYENRGERYGQGREDRRGSEYREPFEQDQWGHGQSSYGSPRGQGRGYSQSQADGEPYERGQGRTGQGSQQYGQFGMKQGYAGGGRWEGDRREQRSYGSGRAEYSGSPSQFRRAPSFSSEGEESWRPSEQFDGFDRSADRSLGSSGPPAPTRGQGGRMGPGFSGGFGESYGQRMGTGFRQGRFTGKGPKGYKRSDERIKEDVSEALERDGDLDASEIEVVVAYGEVTLEGMVPDRQSKRLAEDLVEDLPGVKQVHNRLRIESGQGTEKETSGSGKGSSSASTSGKSTGRSL
ncbi:MAG: BON domain-containing protein [Thermoanaerobaculia bacterium]